MNTAFGKFVSEKFFDKLFLLFLLAGTVFMACAKGSAVLVLTDSPWLSGVVCILYMVLSNTLLYHILKPLVLSNNHVTYILKLMEVVIFCLDIPFLIIMYIL